MTTANDETRDERAADARLVERIAQVHAPAPLDDAGRARFDARLRERLEPRAARGPRRLVAPLAGVAALVALVFFGVARGPLAPVEESAPGEDVALVAWEWDLLGGELEGGEAVDEDLPEDYAAIASVFLAR